jgi:glycine betaine/proline transport system ATP-binding protein
VMRDLMNADPVTVTSETPLAELFTPCSVSGMPVGVVDGDDRLVGVIPRVALLAALGEQPETAHPLVPGARAAVEDAVTATGGAPRQAADDGPGGGAPGKEAADA